MVEPNDKPEMLTPAAIEALRQDAILQRKQRNRAAATDDIINAVRLWDRPMAYAFELAHNYDPKIAARRGETVTPERLRQAAEFVWALAKEMESLANPEEIDRLRSELAVSQAENAELRESLEAQVVMNSEISEALDQALGDMKDGHSVSPETKYKMCVAAGWPPDKPKPEPAGG
jgi:hypothetical protein